MAAYRHHDAALEGMIADGLRNARVRRHLSLRELSQRLPVSNVVLHYWEPSLSFPAGFSRWATWRRVLGERFEVRSSLLGAGPPVPMRWAGPVQVRAQATPDGGSGAFGWDRSAVG